MRIAPFISGIAISISACASGFFIAFFLFILALGNGGKSPTISNLIVHMGYIVVVIAFFVGLMIAAWGLVLPGPPKDPRYHNVPWPKENGPENMDENIPINEIILPPKSRQRTSQNHSEKHFQNLHHHDPTTKKRINRQGTGHLYPEGGAHTWQA